MCKANVHFNIVKCVKGGKGFIEGDYYASFGWNNGVYVLKTSEQGNPEDYYYASCDEEPGKTGQIIGWDEEDPKFDYVDDFYLFNESTPDERLCFDLHKMLTKLRAYEVYGSVDDFQKSSRLLRNIKMAISDK